MLNREDRINAVRILLLTGEHQISSITRIINRDHGMKCRQSTIEKDLQAIRTRNQSWMHRIADGEADLRAEYFHKMLSKNIELLETAIQSTLKEVGGKGAYRAAQLYPQLLNTIHEIYNLEERFPMYKSNAALRDRLRAREAELEAKLAKADQATK